MPVCLALFLRFGRKTEMERPKRDIKPFGLDMGSARTASRKTVSVCCDSPLTPRNKACLDIFGSKNKEACRNQ